MTTWSRLPLRLSHLPMMVSDSPPTWPGAQIEYTSAVSMKLQPASSQASSSEKLVASSTVQPNTLPPKASGETCSPELPSARRGTDELCGAAVETSVRVESFMGV